jgi:hypothetical protein
MNSKPPSPPALSLRSAGEPHVRQSSRGSGRNGGEVDEKYLADSGDTTVRLKQSLREEPQSVHKFIGFLARMARNLHEGFHEIFPPELAFIKEFERRKSLTRSAER